MRSLVGFLVLVAAFLVAAVLAVPAVLEPAVVSAVRTASPFGDQPIDVKVDLDALGLLGGVVREIHVTGSDLQRDDVTIAALDITAHDVSIGDHTATRVEGSLGGVDVPLDNGATLRVSSIELAGPSSLLAATARFDAAEAVAFVQQAFDQQGLSVGDIQLAQGGVSFVIFEQRVTVPLSVEEGALVVPDLLGGGPMELLAPLEGDPWRLTGVGISTGGMELNATVDGDRLLGGAQAGSGE